MTFSGFGLLWFVLAVGCVAIGTVLTRKRAIKASLRTRVPRRATRVRGSHSKQGCAAKAPPQAIPLRMAARGHRDTSEQDSAACARCAQPLEVGARFCGACGLYVHSVLNEQRTRGKIVKRADA